MLTRLLTTLLFASSLLFILPACGGDSSADAHAQSAKSMEADAHADDHKGDHEHNDMKNHEAMADHKDMKDSGGMEMATEDFKYRCADESDKLRNNPGKCADGSLATAVVPAGAEIEYYCTMDAEQLSEVPGRCTECGMYLSARAKGAVQGDHEGHDHQ